MTGTEMEGRTAPHPFLLYLTQAVSYNVWDIHRNPNTVSGVRE